MNNNPLSPVFVFEVLNPSHHIWHENLSKKQQKVFCMIPTQKLLWANPFNGGYSTSHTILTKMELNEGFFTEKK